MKVLIACEYSGITRNAFIKNGHDAWSCDLLPTDLPGPHIQGDALEVINSRQFDLLIAHPPCTYLSYAATKYWNRPGREEKREAALRFFMACINAPIARVCVENPVGYPNTVYRAPDQLIHPFYFGDRQLKLTCLWLRGLKKLWYYRAPTLFEAQTSTEYPEPTYTDKSGKKRYFTDANHGGHIRSKTFQGIANAMANQWGSANT